MGLGVYHITSGKWYLFDQATERATSEEITVSYWLDPDWNPETFMEEEETTVHREKKRQRILLG